MFPCFLFLRTTELFTITSDALALFIDLLYTAWPPPPGVFRCFLVGFLFSRRPNALFLFAVFCWLRFCFWVVVRFRARSACGLAGSSPPLPLPPFPPLCCLLVFCILHLCLACTNPATCRPQWPRPLLAHYLARPSSPASCWETSGGVVGQ